jgi:hypothetical protein
MKHKIALAQEFGVAGIFDLAARQRASGLLEAPRQVPQGRGCVEIGTIVGNGRRPVPLMHVSTRAERDSGRSLLGSTPVHHEVREDLSC